MSENLLTTRLSGSPNLSTKYMIRPNIDSTVSSSMSTEHNRIIYMLSKMGTNYIIQSFNMLTSKFSNIGTLTSADLGNPSGGLGSIVADNDYIYLSRQGYGTLYRIKISDLSINTFTATNSSSAYGIMQWYDDNRNVIVISTSYGFSLFNTISCTWSYIKNSSNTSNKRDIAVGNRSIITTSTSSASGFIYYDKIDGTFTAQSLPSNDLSNVCYNNGKYYFARKSYLYIYDEDTKTFDETIAIPYEDKIQSLVYSDGVIFATISGSNKLYAYSIDSHMYYYIYLPWTTVSDTSVADRITGYNKYVFIPNITFGIINYISSSKYAVGYKMNQYSVLYNNTYADKFTKDPNLELNDSFCTIVDGSEEKDMIIIDAERSIKSVHVNKTDYQMIKNIHFIS